MLSAECSACMRQAQSISRGSQGRTVSFANTLVIMTSNVGSAVIAKGGGSLGFQLATDEEDGGAYNRISSLVKEELKVRSARQRLALGLNDVARQLLTYSLLILLPVLGYLSRPDCGPD